MHTTQTVGNVQVKFEDLESERPICNILVTGQLYPAQLAYVECLKLEYRVHIFFEEYTGSSKCHAKADAGTVKQSKFSFWKLIKAIVIPPIELIRFVLCAFVLTFLITMSLIVGDMWDVRYFLSELQELPNELVERTYERVNK